MTRPFRLSAIGGGAGAVLGVEDVFSTYLYTGNGAAQSVKNNIQLGGIPTNGTVLHLTGDTLTDSAPVPCGLVNNFSVVVNTTTKKYGTGSLYIPSTASDITAYSPDLQFGTGDFTVECWVYATSTANQGVFQLGSDSWGAGSVFVSMYPAYQFQWGWDNNYASAGTFSINTWVHVALVRQGNTLKLYVNGTQTGSTNTYSGTINVGACKVGAYYAGGFSLNGGYIDDFRVSNKVVYTGNFTPPASALSVDTLVAGSNYGGMVWIKDRTNAYNHVLTDTVRGATSQLYSNLTNAATTSGVYLSAFASTGFSVGNSAPTNTSSAKDVSWTFRKQPKFFDVVTYTGTGVARTIAHNLGSVPGCIIIKRLDDISNWPVYHRSNLANDAMFLNTTDAINPSKTYWNNTRPTSTVFSLGDDSIVNQNGGTFVAYLFAHDAGGFGASGNDNVISCGTFSGASATINLGWEPQWILIKSANASSNWWIRDVMRGMTAIESGSIYGKALYANLSDAEVDTSYYVNPNSTGFSVSGWIPGQDYIYIAIRRGPMKTPTSGTQVYKGVTRNGTGSSPWVASGAGFPPDMSLMSARDTGNAANNTSYHNSIIDRVRRATEHIQTVNQNAEGGGWGQGHIHNMDGYDGLYSSDASYWATSGQRYIDNHFRRAPGFMDIVYFTGTGSSRTVNHGLQVSPEMIICKRRDSSGAWNVYTSALGVSKNIEIQYNYAAYTVSGIWSSVSATNFGVGTDATINASGGKYIAYLFATCPGISKVGTYTGTGSPLTVNCGFTTGARFVLIKRTDNSGDWWFFDTARGMASGSSKALWLNTGGAAEVSGGYVYTTSVGFVVESSILDLNTSGGTYMYLAIS